MTTTTDLRPEQITDIVRERVLEPKRPTSEPGWLAIDAEHAAFNPFTDANDDYRCLEKLREMGEQEQALCPSGYEKGDWATALAKVLEDDK